MSKCRSTTCQASRVVRGIHRSGESSTRRLGSCQAAATAAASTTPSVSQRWRSKRCSRRSSMPGGGYLRGPWGGAVGAVRSALAQAGRFERPNVQRPTFNVEHEAHMPPFDVGPSTLVRTAPCHLVTLSPCHLVTLSPCHLVTLSPCHLVTLSPCHLVTLSPCHLVTLSPCHLAKHGELTPRRSPSCGHSHFGCRRISCRMMALRRLSGSASTSAMPTAAETASAPPAVAAASSASVAAPWSTIVPTV